MTSSNTAAGGLDLRCKDDSNFPHYIDICQMVEILCAPIEYFQWYIFPEFTCKTTKTIGAKPIRECLDDNKWTMNFPIGMNTIFFQQQ